MEEAGRLWRSHTQPFSLGVGRLVQLLRTENSAMVSQIYSCVRKQLPNTHPGSATLKSSVVPRNYCKNTITSLITQGWIMLGLRPYPGQ